MIDFKANDISYDNGKTLADFIDFTIQSYLRIYCTVVIIIVRTR